MPRRKQLDLRQEHPYTTTTFHYGRSSRNGVDENSTNSENCTTTSSEVKVGDADSIIKTAVGLSRKLPWDLVPSILDHAEMWVPLATARSDRPVNFNESETYNVVLRCELPANMPDGVIRQIKVTAVSRGQGWILDGEPEDRGRYLSSFASFDLEVVKARDRKGRMPVSKIDGTFWREWEDRLWHREIIRNIHAGIEWRTYEFTWNWSDTDSEIAEVGRQLQGGDVVQLCVRSRYAEVQMQSAFMELKGIYLRRI